MRICDFPEDHGERRGLIDVRRMPSSQRGENTPPWWYFRVRVVHPDVEDVRVRAVGEWISHTDDDTVILYEIAVQVLRAGLDHPTARLPDGRLLSSVAPVDLYA